MTKSKARKELEETRKLTLEIVVALGLPKELLSALAADNITSEDYDTVIDKLIENY